MEWRLRWNWQLLELDWFEWGSQIDMEDTRYTSSASYSDERSVKYQ